MSHITIIGGHVGFVRLTAAQLFTECVTISRNFTIKLALLATAAACVRTMINHIDGSPQIADALVQE